MVYYLIVHEPARDPFRVNAQETGGLFRPNPVDKIILQSFRGAMKHTPLIKHMEPKAKKKIEIFFLKVNSFLMLGGIFPLLITILT